jgi:hypothetical protein
MFNEEAKPLLACLQRVLGKPAFVDFHEELAI